MIGVVSNTKIFEFRDENELCNALDWLFDKYGSDLVFITDSSDKIKAIIRNGNFKFSPNLIDEQKYYLYGTTAKALEIAGISIDYLNRQDELPRLRDWQTGPFTFIFKTQKVPKDLDI